MFQIGWTTYPNNAKYSALNNEHKWEDLWILINNQQTCIFYNHSYIKGGPTFNPILDDHSS